MHKIRILRDYNIVTLLGTNKTYTEAIYMDNTVNPGIFCSVQQCTYNENGQKCTANKIEVGSSKDCCSACDTECVTFKSR